MLFTEYGDKMQITNFCYAMLECIENVEMFGAIKMPFDNPLDFPHGLKHSDSKKTSKSLSISFL
jgi:hypothetical protein